MTSHVENSVVEIKFLLRIPSDHGYKDNGKKAEDMFELYGIFQKYKTNTLSSQSMVVEGLKIPRNIHFIQPF